MSASPEEIKWLADMSEEEQLETIGNLKILVSSTYQLGARGALELLYKIDQEIERQKDEHREEVYW